MTRIRVNAVAYISAQNHPILIRTFTKNKQDDLKYHYAAHTSLDVIEERVGQNPKVTDCYLGLLYSLEDIAVYGYMTPSKLKIIIALALTDLIVRDADVVTIFKALHVAYQQSLSNPFLRLFASPEATLDPTNLLTSTGDKWKGLKQRVDDIGHVVGANAGNESQ